DQRLIPLHDRFKSGAIPPRCPIDQLSVVHVVPASRFMRFSLRPAISGPAGRFGYIILRSCS
ncbi:MAG: hypothetical protein QM442_08900, partial [Spirochaetota bacterium]|nr:hypothetical protein [Spirochaetota bacterium]